MKIFNQKGFTLLELMISLAVTAIIGVAIGSVVVHVTAVNAGSTTHEIAIKQVENAVHIISRDALQTQWFSVDSSQNSNHPDDSDSDIKRFNLADGDKLVLTWTEFGKQNVESGFWETSTKKIIYTLINGELNETISTSVNGGQSEDTVIGTASHVNAAEGSWDTAQKELTFTITATVTGYRPSSETRTFHIRPSSAQ